MLNESSLNAKYDEMSERLARLKQVAIDNGIILADQVPEESPEFADFVDFLQDDICHGSHDGVVGDLVYYIALWHGRRNLIDGSTDKDQYLKLIQEVGELSESICKKQDIRDDIGDIIVVLINLMIRNKLTLADCLEKAFLDIAPRKGKMIDGIFVKQKDLDAMAAKEEAK